MSSELFFENKKYISAKDAAMLTSYSSDYIGQLCRVKKIDSKKIGHTWYVNEESILNHKNFGTEFSPISATKTFQKESFAKTEKKTIKTPDLSRHIEKAHRKIFSHNLNFLSKMAAVCLVLILIIGAFSTKDEILALASNTVELTSVLPEVTSRTFLALENDYTKISSTISNAPVNSYKALADVTVFYSSEMSGELLFIGTTLENAGHGLVSETGKFFGNPSLYIVNSVGNFAKIEDREMDKGFAFSGNTFDSAYVKTFSFISDSTSALPFVTSEAVSGAKGLTAGAVLAVQEKTLTPVDQAGMAVYDGINNFFDTNIYGPLATLFNSKPVVVAPTVLPSIAQIPSTPIVLKNSQVAIQSQSTKAVTNTVTNTIEKVITPATNSVTSDELDLRLQEMNNKIEDQFAKLSSGPGGNVTNVYQEIADSQRIDQLNGTDITAATINDSTINGGSINGASIDADTLSTNTLTAGTGTFSGNVGIGTTTPPQDALDVVGNANISGTLTVGSLVTGGQTIGGDFGVIGTTTLQDLLVTGSTTIENLSFQNISGDNSTTTNATTTNLFATNFSATNATTTNLFANLFQASTGVIDTFNSTLATIDGLNVTNSTTTNATTTNSFVTNGDIENLLATNATTTNLFSTNLLSENSTTTNLFADDINANTITATTSAALGTTTVTNLAVTNTSTSTFAGGISVGGNINFNGTLLQNNSPFISTQWTTNGPDISYSSGNVGIGTTSPWQNFSVAGNLSVTGSIFDSNSSAGANGSVLQTTGNGTQWVATSSLGIIGGIQTLNGLSSLNQTFATSSNNGGWGITSSGSTHTLNIPQASATNPLGLLSSADWTAFNGKQNALGYTPLDQASYFSTTTQNTITTLPVLSITKSQVSDFGTYEVPLTFSNGLTRTVNDIAPTVGYNIPLTSSTTNWNSAYNTVTASSTDWNTTYLDRIVSSTYPLQISSNNISLAFGTTTNNIWNGTNTFNNTLTLGNVAINSLLSTNNSGNVVATSTPTFGNFNATSTTATSTIAGAVDVTKGIQLNNGYFFGAGLSACSGSSSKLIWDAATGQFGCGLDAGSTSGLGGLGAQYSPIQTGSTQTLATSTSLDANIRLSIISASDTQTFTPSWFGTLAPSRGGTGQDLSSASGLLNFYNGTAGTISTSTLGLLTTNVAEGTNLYFTNARAQAALSSSATGLSYNNTSGIFSLSSGYNIPLTSSTTNWNSAYNTLTASSTNWNNTYNIVNASSTDWNTTYLDRIVSSTYPLQISSNNISLAFGTTTNNIWNGTNTFNNTLTLGNVAINSLLSTNNSGNVVATSTPTFGNFNATSTTATSTIAGAVDVTKGIQLNNGYFFGAGLSACSGSSSKLIWDAATGQFGCGLDAGSTSGLGGLGAQYSPIQTGSTQTLATSTSLDANIRLSIISASDTQTFTPSWFGTLAPSRGGTGQDLSSASGLLNFYNGTAGTISTSTLGLLTTNVAEGTNLYFTNARAQAALSSSATGLSYNNTSGIFSLSSGYNIPLTSSTTNWNSAYNTLTASSTNWNNTYNIVNASSTDWNTTYLDRIVSSTYPLQISSNNISLAFGTTTNNIWNGTNTFNNTLTLGNVAINSLLSTNNSGNVVATSTPTFGNFNATSTTATSTIAGAVDVTKGIQLNNGYFFGAGLSACDPSSGKIIWNAVTGQFACGSDAGSGGGLTSLNGLTAAVQTFATSSTNGGWGITSGGTIHTLNIPQASATNPLGLLSAADWTTFNNKDSFAFPFTVSTGYNSTSTVLGLNGFFSTASSTISGNFYTPNLSQGFLYVGSNGLHQTVASSTIAALAPVQSVGNTDTTLTISPNTGAVVASLNLGHSNTWTVNQSFNYSSSTNYSSFVTASTTNLLAGTISLNGSDLQTTLNGKDTFAWPFTVSTGYNSTTSTIGFLNATNGIFAVASSTFGSSLYLPSLSQGFSYIGSSGQVNSIASSSVKLSWFNNDSNFVSFPFTVSTGYNSTSTVLGLNGFFSTASSTISGNFYTPNLSQGFLYVGSNGLHQTVASSTIAALAPVQSVGNTDTTLTISPNTGAVVASLNLGHSNTWTVNQSFNYSSSTAYSSFVTASTTNLIVNGQSFNNLLGSGLSDTGGALTVSGVPLSSLAALPINSIVTTNSSGTLIATGTQLTVGNLLATSTTGISQFWGNTGISTSSPWAQFAINPIAGQAANQFVIGSSTGTSFVVNNAGNVGIGTVNPVAQLSVTGTTTNIFSSGSDIISAIFGSNPGTGGNGIALNNTNGASHEQNYIAFASQGSILWAIGNDPNNNGGQAFNIYDNVAGETRLQIDSSGNVGIGTTSPSQLLTVGNNNQFTVDSSGNIIGQTATIGQTAIASVVVNGNGGGILGSPNGVYAYKGQLNGYNYYQLGNSSFYIYHQGSNWWIGSILGSGGVGWYVLSSTSLPAVSGYGGYDGSYTGAPTTNGGSSSTLAVDIGGNLTAQSGIFGAGAASIVVSGNGGGGAGSPNGTYTYVGQHNGHNEYQRGTDSMYIYYSNFYAEWFVGPTLDSPTNSWYLGGSTQLPTLTGYGAYTGATGTATLSAGNASLVVIDTAGDLTMGGQLAVTGSGNSYILGNVGISTTTPQYLLTISSSTAPQLSLSAGANFGQVTFRNDGTNFYISTTTIAGTATTSISALQIALGGFGTTTVRGLNISGFATSTSNVGLNITTGCFSLNGNCLTQNVGTVTSVGLTDSNSTLTIGSSPVTSSGNITATLNLGHSNTWTVNQSFNYSSSTNYSSFVTASTTNLLAGTISLNGSDLQTTLNGKDTFAWPFTVSTGYNSTTSTIGFLNATNGIFAVASSTFGSSLYLPSLSQGFSYIGSSGQVNSIASSSVKLSWFNNDSNFVSFPFTVSTGYNSTSTVLGLNGFFSTASSTISGALNLPSLALNSILSTNASGVLSATSTPTFGNFNATSTTATSTIAGGLSVGGSNFMVDRYTGNVGIGTTSPSYPLSVNGNSYINGLVGIGAVPNTGSSVSLYVVSTDQAADFVSNLANTSTNGRAFMVGATGEGFVRTIFYSNGTIGIGPGNNTRDTFISRAGVGTLQLSSNFDGTGAANLLVNGNVGIGTTTPGSLLSIGNTGGINFSLGTSTFSTAGGINLARGCFAVGGTCVGGSLSWGSITGTLSAQTDLQNALDAKISVGTTSVASITTLPNLSITKSQVSDFGGPYLAAAVTSLNGLTASVQTFATSSNNGGWGITSSGSTHTLNIPQANGTNALGLLSSADWTNFNGKQSALGFTPVTNLLPKGDFLVGSDSGVAQATSTISISSTGLLGIGTTSPSQLLTVGNNNQFTVTGAGNVTANSLSVSSFTTGTFCVHSVNGLLQTLPSDCGAGGSGSSAWSIGTGIIFNATSTDLVGVGTTSPSAKLSVKGNGTGTGRAFVVSDASDNENLTVLDNGYVGIGTDNPTGRLSLSAAPSDSAPLLVLDTGSSANPYAIQFSSSGASTAYVGLTSTPGHTWGTLSWYADLSPHFDDVFTLGSLANRWHSIDVGTGNSEFDGAVTMTDGLNVSSGLSVSGGLVLPSLTNSLLSTDNSGNIVATSTPTVNNIWATSPSAVNYFAGNVGVGVVTPAQALQVNGNISASDQGLFGNLTADSNGTYLSTPNQDTYGFGSITAGGAYPLALASGNGGQFYTGTSLTLASSGQGITYYSGYFWVTNLSGAVYKYNLDGSYTGTSFSTTGSGNNDPRGLVYYNGYFWIVSYNNNKVYKYDTSGVYTGISFSTSVSGHTGSAGIAYYGNHFWITSYDNNYVDEFNLDGSYAGTSFITANHPFGIVNYNNDFYVASYSSAKIYQYTSAGVSTGISYDTSVSGDTSPAGLAYYSGYLWTTDQTNSNIYKYSSNSSSGGYISLSTDGSEKLRVDNLGNVGIGTTTPSAKLDIAGTLGSQSVLFNVSSTTATNVVSSLFNVNANGNVGIGTNTPLTALSIVSSGASGWEPVTVQSTNPDISSAIDFLDTSGNSQGAIGYGNSLSGNMFVYASTNLIFVTGASQTEKMRITPGGNVGIGTTTPTNALTIATTSGAQLTLSNGAGLAQWAFANEGGNLYFATTTLAGTATSSVSALSINPNGQIQIPNLSTSGFVKSSSNGTLSVDTTSYDTFAWPFTVSTGYNSTSTVLGLNGFFSTASSTISGNFYTPNLSQGFLYVGSNGLHQTVASSTIAALAPVQSVGNTDTTLTISPNTGAVVASLNLGHSNTWTVNQSFNYSSSTNYSSFVTASTTNLLAGTISLNGSDLQTTLNGKDTFAWPFTVSTGYNSTTSTIGFLNATNGIFAVASSTFGSSLYLPSLSQGFSYIGSSGQVNSIASSSVKLSWFNNDSNFVSFPFTVSTGYNSTSTVLGLNGFFSTASSTISGNFYTPNLSQGFLYVGSNGLHQTVASSTIAALAPVQSVGNTDTTLTISPNTGAVVASLNLGHSNTWTVNQSFNYSSSTAYSSFVTASTTNLIVNGQSFNNLLGSGLSDTGGALTVSGVPLSSLAALPINSIVTTNSSGTLIATGTQLTVGNLLATSTTGISQFWGNTGISTSSPWAQFAINPIAGQAANQFVIGSSTGTSFVVNNAGNVGIGTAAPDQKLEVYGNEHIGNFGNLFMDSGSYLNFGTIGNASAQIQGGESPNYLALRTSNATRVQIDTNGLVGISTTTPQYLLTISSSTAPQLSLSAGANFGQVTFRNDGTNFYISTTTIAGTATTSISALQIALGGFGTTTVRGLNISGFATSTSNVGLNITTGCFSLNGNCLTQNVGTVTSVGLTDSNSTLTIGSSPVTSSGNITATLNLGHSNTWTVNQSFNYSSSTNYSSFVTASTTNLLAGTISLNGSDLQTTLNGKDTFAWPFTVSTGYNSTTSTIGFLNATNGIFAVASSTFGSSLYLPSLSQGFSYIGSSGQVNSIASSSVKLSWFNNDSNFVSFPFTVSTGYNSTSTVLGLNGFFSTASSTISGNFYTPNLSQGFLYVGSNGLHQTVASSTIAALAPVQSVGNTDTTLTISPNTGAVVASLNLGHSNTWTVNQSFNYSSSTNYSSFVTASTTNLLAGTISLNGSDLQTTLNGKDTFAWPFTVSTGYNSTTSTIGFLNATNGIFAVASSTFGSSLYLPSLSQGFSYIGSSGQVNSIASSSVKLSWFNNDSNFVSFPFTVSTGYNSTSTVLGLNGFFSTASSTISGNFYTPNLSQGFLYVGSNGLHQTVASSTIAALAPVQSVGNTDTTLTISPNTGAVVASLNLGHSNTWTVNQSFNYSSSTNYSSFVTASTTNLLAGTISLNGSDLQTTLNGKDTFAWPFTVSTGYNSTSTVLGLNGFFSTASSTISGALNLPSLALNSILSTNASGVLSATSTPTFGNFNATSTTATSTIAGGLSVGGSNFMVDRYTGNVGIGTTSPSQMLTVGNNNQFTVDSSGNVNIPTGSLQIGPALTGTNISPSGLSVHNLSMNGTGISSLGYVNYIPNGSFGLGGGITHTASIVGYSGQGLNNADVAIRPTYNDNGQTGVANTDLMIQRTETNLGTTPGAQYLLEAGTSTNANLFSVTDTGQGYFAGNLGIGTTTPTNALTIATTSGAQLTLSNGAGLAQWAFANEGGNLYFSTTTVAGTATSSLAALTVSGTGFGTTTILGLNITGQATSTSNVGFNLTGGCFAVGGNCISGAGGGGSGTVSASTLQGQVPFYNSVGTTLTATSTLYIAQSGNIGIGTASPISKLDLEGNTTASGANAIAGLFASTTLTNLTTNGYQFGDRMISTINGTAVGTEDGLFVRTIDNTTLSNTVRGLEVQAYSGSNTNGVNTGIAAYGSTFGIQAYTTALSGGVSQPAAVFAQLDNGSAPTVGNAIRAYTNSATSATLVSLYQETSAFSGEGLQMSFGNGGGSASFTGNFLDLQNAGSSKFKTDYYGRTVIGAGTIGSMLDISSSTTSTNFDMFRIISNVGGTNNVKFRVDSSGNIFTDGGTTIGSPADLAENYPVAENDLSAGDVVSMSTSTMVELSYSEDNNATTSISGLVKSSPTQQNILGIVSTNPGVLLSGSSQNSVPVALSGRVPVKVSDENGTISASDYLTVSKLYPGYAAKALYSGEVIGQALESFGTTTQQDGDTSTSTIMVFVKVGWQNVNNQFVLGDNGGGQLTGSVDGGAPTDANDTSFLINQKGSGNILQLQSNDEDRFMVATSGAVSILAQIADATTTELLTVQNNSSEVFSVNSRGDVAVKGVLIAADNNFAGSIATGEDGTADVNFTYSLGTGKPVVELTPESDSPVFAQILSWKKDSNQNYIGLTIKTFGINGSAVSSIVHYIIVGKSDGYDTSGTVINVVSAPSGQVVSSTDTTSATTTATTDTTPDTTATTTASTIDTTDTTSATSTTESTTVTDTTASSTSPDTTASTPADAPAASTDTSGSTSSVSTASDSQPVASAGTDNTAAAVESTQ